CAGGTPPPGRLTGQADPRVGSPVATRDRVEVGGLIGLFVNTLVLRGRPAGELEIGAHLARTREEVLDAYDDRDLPLEALVEALAPERDLSRTPLFQVLFALQNVPASGLSLPGLE